MSLRWIPGHAQLNGIVVVLVAEFGYLLTINGRTENTADLQGRDTLAVGLFAIDVDHDLRLIGLEV